MLVGGRPARHYRLNTVGLKRAGITGERYNVLSAAFRLLKNKKSLDDLEETEELKFLKNWLAVKSKRGLHGFVDISAD
jgi:UDP-N-acetylglucosamine acyltransferase